MTGLVRALRLLTCGIEGVELGFIAAFNIGVRDALEGEPADDMIDEKPMWKDGYAEGYAFATRAKEDESK